MRGSEDARKLDLTAPGDPSYGTWRSAVSRPSARHLIPAEDDAAPEIYRRGQYEFLGDADIPFSRDRSREFCDREIDRMWSRTWQWACREEHAPNAGDYHVYDVGPYSVLVVRQETGQIKAFVNSCPPGVCSSRMRVPRAVANSFCAVPSTACPGIWTARCGRFPAVGTSPMSTMRTFA